MRSPLLAVPVSCCLLAASAVAQQPLPPADPDAPVPSPDRVVSTDPAVVAQIAELRAHIELLQAEVARLRALLVSRGLDPNAAAPAPPAEPGTDPRGPAPTPAREDAQTFRSVVQVLREMPREIMPNAARWDDFDRAAALNWLDDNARGHRFDVGLELASHALTPNPFHDEANDQLPWQLVLTFKPRDYGFAQLQLDQVITVPPMPVTDAQAQRLGRLREGMVLPVSGTIHAADLQPGAARQLEVRIDLVDVVIDAPFFAADDG